MIEIFQKLRRIFLSVFILIFAILLTSCFEVKQDVSVNKDGSGEARIEFAVEKAFAPEFIPHIKNKTPSGWQIVGELEKNGKQVILMERKFKNLSELSDNDMRYSFSSEKTGFMKETYSINIFMLKTSDMPFPYALTIKVPGSIEETSGIKGSSNAVHWDMQGFRRDTVLSVRSQGLALPNPSALFGSLRGYFRSLLVEDRIALNCQDENGYAIYIMNPEGKQLKRLASSQNSQSFPAFSPDGKKIAFVRDFSIYIMDSNGSNIKRLSDGSSRDTAPSWSPDGKKLAFTSNRDGNENIFMMNSDGSSILRLTSGTSYSGVPSWSPDGKKIAFSSIRSGVSNIYVINIDGSNIYNISSDNTGKIAPIWSPDGKKIAYIGNEIGSSGQVFFNIATMDADGKNIVRLTEKTAGLQVPAWSPDGNKIIFSGNFGGSDGYYSINIDGSNMQSVPIIVGHPVSIERLSWIAISRIPFLPVNSANIVALFASILTLLIPVAGSIILIRMVVKRRPKPVKSEGHQHGLFCVNCGAKLSSNSLFCVNCGAKLSD